MYKIVSFNLQSYRYLCQTLALIKKLAGSLGFNKVMIVLTSGKVWTLDSMVTYLLSF